MYGTKVHLKIMSAALCHTAYSVFRSAAFRSSPHTHGRALRQIARMSIVSPSAKPLYDLYVKGSPEKGELGDCKRPVLANKKTQDIVGQAHAPLICLAAA